MVPVRKKVMPGGAGEGKVLCEIPGEYIRAFSTLYQTGYLVTVKMVCLLFRL